MVASSCQSLSGLWTPGAPGDGERAWCSLPVGPDALGPTPTRTDNDKGTTRPRCALLDPPSPGGPRPRSLSRSTLRHPSGVQQLGPQGPDRAGPFRRPARHGDQVSAPKDRLLQLSLPLGQLTIPGSFSDSHNPTNGHNESRSSVSSGAPASSSTRSAAGDENELPDTYGESSERPLSDCTQIWDCALSECLTPGTCQHNGACGQAPAPIVVGKVCPTCEQTFGAKSKRTACKGSAENPHGQVKLQPLTRLKPYECPRCSGRLAAVDDFLKCQSCGHDQDYPNDQTPALNRPWGDA